MATVRIPAEQRTLTDQAEVTEYLATLGIEYERWPLSQRAAANARGRGLFHIHPRDEAGPVIAIEVEGGDLIRVPRGTWHWFDLCGDRDIRAIRLFQDKAGWTPHYTNSGTDKGYQPLCLGPSYIPLR